MPAVCYWKEDTDGNYEADCGQAFTMIDGAPEENDMRFCCYCGRVLKTVRYQEEA